MMKEYIVVSLGGTRELEDGLNKFAGGRWEPLHISEWVSEDVETEVYTVIFAREKLTGGLE